MPKIMMMNIGAPMVRTLVFSSPVLREFRSNVVLATIQPIGELTAPLWKTLGLNHSKNRGYLWLYLGYGNA